MKNHFVIKGPYQLLDSSKCLFPVFEIIELIKRILMRKFSNSNNFNKFLRSSCKSKQKTKKWRTWSLFGNARTNQEGAAIFTPFSINFNFSVK